MMEPRWAAAVAVLWGLGSLTWPQGSSPRSSRGAIAADYGIEQFTVFMGSRDERGNDEKGAMASVKTGAEALLAKSSHPFAGKRVGLIANHTSVAGDVHLADVLAGMEGVKLAAIFAPEHGFRGEAEAGALVESAVDARTGAQIFSLYGKTRKPTTEMLRNLDVLVFDIQDIGVRFYTYISTMGLAMQAAAEAGVPFVVLDRPNPLGGDYVAGFVLERSQRSFVGEYEIPIAHGLTAGELARMIKGERLLPGLERLDLTVVPMTGWRRSMRWPDTGLPWRKTSPNITTFEAALVYAGTGLFEATAVSDGRGTPTPFQVVGAPWADGERMAAELNGDGLPGVRFEPARFTPRAIKGVAEKPTLEGRAVAGVRVAVTDARAYRPVETGVYVLEAFARQARAGQGAEFLAKEAWMGKLAGTGRLQALLKQGAGAAAIISSWKDEVGRYEKVRERYLLY
jgi:uncharacterized protein YbbC (DUF1343 family)